MQSSEVSRCFPFMKNKIIYIYGGSTLIPQDDIILLQISDLLLGLVQGLPVRKDVILACPSQKGTQLTSTNWRCSSLGWDWSFSSAPLAAAAISHPPPCTTSSYNIAWAHEWQCNNEDSDPGDVDTQSNLLLVSSWTFNRCTFSSIPVTFVEQIHWEAFQHYKTQRIWKLVLVGRYVSTPTFAILYGESWFLLDEKTTCAFSDWTSAPRTLFSLWEEIIIQKMSEIIHVFNFQTKESPAVGSSQCSLSLSASDSATPKKLPWFFFS